MISIQGSYYGGGTSSTASVEAYLDPSGSADGPTGDPITISASIDLSSEPEVLAQFSIDVADLGIEISSGDVYIVINDGGGFLSLADDLEPVLVGG